MTRFNKLLIFVLLAFSLISCANHVKEEYDPTTYGSCRNVKFNSSLNSIIPEGDIECTLLNKENQPIILTGHHINDGGVSKLSFNSYLPLGEHLLSSVKYFDENNREKEVKVGCNIVVDEDSSTPFPADFDTKWNLFGLGTNDSPYLIINLDSFCVIDDITNSDEGSAGIHFKQIFDIDFFDFILSDSGFKGIATSPSRPFKGYYNGNNKKITSLIIERVAPEDQDKVSSEVKDPTALFCNVSQAVIKNVIIESPSISGQDWTGSLVGAVVGQGGEVDASTSIINCHLTYDNNYSNLEIVGRKYVGGLIGGVDEYASLFIQNCSNESGNIIKAATPEVGGGFIGGLIGVGILESQISIDNCQNNSAINTNTTICVGGIIGAAQSASISNATNNAEISNSYSGSLGTGGIIGGSGDIGIISSVNNAPITGYRGVSGILGSTVYDVDNELYADASVSNCHNYGAINGTQSLGGIIGESQAMLYNCYNIAMIGNSDMIADYAGGIIGFAPGCVVTGCANKGDVYGGISGGIVGISHLYAIQANSNLGNIAASSKSGGIIGIGGECGNLTYCANYGQIYSASADCGGIAGALGNTTQSDYSRLKSVLLSDAKTDFKFVKFLYKKYIDTSVSTFDRIVAKIKPVINVQKSITNLRDVIVKAVNWDSGDEIDGWSSSGDQLIDENTTALDNKMYSEVASSCKNAYKGVVTLNGDDIATTFNNNITKLGNALSTEDNCDTFSDNTASYLTNISKKDTETQEITSIVLSAFKCVIAVSSLFAPSKYSQLISTSSFFGNNILSAIDYAAGNSAENTISANHLVNFGSFKYNGNGLIGVPGDCIRLQHSIHAGTDASYAFSNVGNSNNSVFEYLVSIGEDIPPYSNVSPNNNNRHDLIYPDTSAEDFANGDAFKDYDSNLWKSQGTSGFRLPFNSMFLNFQ